MEEGGLLQSPDAAEAPLGGDHALDERKFNFSLGLELGGDGEAEGGEIVGIFAGEEEGGGECSVLEAVAGGVGFRERGLGAMGFPAVGAGGGILCVGAVWHLRF